MILTISLIEDAAKLGSLREWIDKLSWRDGRATAGKTASAVKRNEQAVMTDAAGQTVRKELMPIIETDPVLMAADRPSSDPFEHHF